MGSKTVNTYRAKNNSMNSQHAVSASKNNNIQRTEQSIGVKRDRPLNRRVLDAYLLHCTSCVVISARTHCVQTVYLIIFHPIGA